MIELSPSTENCVIDGVDNADWQSTYGGKTSGNELSLDFVTNGPYSRFGTSIRYSKFWVNFWFF